MSAQAATDAREQVLAELRRASKFCLVTHEHVDGDALGSLVAMRELLAQLGKDVSMFVPDSELPLPPEYCSFGLEGAVGAPPGDIAERTIIFLDCGNIERTPAGACKPPEGTMLVNIDHHHDNTRFGAVNYVVPEASCTAELVWDLAHGLGAEITPSIAEALYIGLVTDTGRFMYENTGARAHRMAAELIDAGVDVNGVYRRLYEGVPYGKLELLARGLARTKRYDDGRLTISCLTRSDFADTGADDSFSEGVIDYLRTVDGTAVAALARELEPDNGSPFLKVSLRSTDARVDVSVIARASGGGGHRRAAGFRTELDWDGVVAFLRAEIERQL